MRELSKPNDIFVATSLGDVSLEDLYANNITGDNTSFYTMDEYKMTPFVKKKYTKDGVFDEFTFEQDYIKASEMFKALTDEKAEKEFIQKELYYDPQSLNAPLGAQRLDPRAVYTKFRNPLEQAVGHEQINTWSAPEKTPEELAQGNKIFDPKTGQFLDVTAETRNIWDKTAGRTLKYAKWENDGTHIDAETGELVNHYAGDWKTDKDGRYYTEIMYDEQLGNAQIVALADTLTKEGSALNKIDFFDSDGYTKSIAGTVFKTAANIAPYLIPGFNKIYGGVVAATNLAKVLPTFYKSIDSMFLGDNHTKLYDNATEMENWFSKFNSSKSYEGRKGFWTLENFGQLASDTFSQLYQQKAVASLSKYLKPVVENESKAVTLSRNALGRNLSLGYMALTSSADMYNEAKNAGYSDHAAGIISLASAGALFGIMNANEAGKGMTSWFLDKTDGVDKTIEPHYFRKLLLKENGILDDVAKIEENFINGNATGVKKWLNPFKKKLLRWQHELEGATAGMWKNAYIEGLEEVSEEAIQDFVKGAADTLSWLGVWKNDTEGFGGWSNVFSKQGLDRYLSTFVGGAVGGAIFEAQNKWIEPAYNEELRRLREYENDRDIVDCILDGHKEDLIKAAKSMRGYFNTDISAQLGTDSSGKALYIASSGGKTQADVIIEGVIQRIEQIDNAIKKSIGDNYQDKNSLFLKENAQPWYDQQKNIIMDTFQKQVVSAHYADKLTKLVEAQQKVDSLKKESVQNASNTSNSKTAELKQAEDALKKAIQDVEDFFNLQNVFKYSSQFALYKNTALRQALSMGAAGSGLDISSYTWQKYKKDYNALPNTSEDPTVITKVSVKNEHDIYIKELNLDEFGEQLENLYNLYLAEMPEVSKFLSEILTEEEQKAWMQSIDSGLATRHEIKQEEGEEDEDFIKRRQQYYTEQAGLLYEAVKNDPKIFSIKDSLYIPYLDQFKDLVDLGTNDPKAKEKQELIIKFLNQQMGLSGNNTLWTQKTLSDFISSFTTNILNKGYNKVQDYYYLQEFYKLIEEQMDDLGITSEQDRNEFIKNSFESISLSRVVREIDNNHSGLDLIEKINNIKQKTILDAVDGQNYINPDLYNQLQKWYEGAIDMLHNNIIDLWKIEFQGEPLPVISNKEKLVNFIINVDNDPDVWEALSLDQTNSDREMYEQLHYLYEGMTNIEDFIDTIQKSPLVPAIKKHQSKNTELLNKKQALKDNPLHKLIKSFIRKFSYDKKHLNLFEYLETKEFEINSLKDLESLELTEGEWEECMQQIQACLTHLQGLIQGTGGYNSDLAEYSKKYSKNHTPDDFIVLTDDGRLAIQKQIDTLQDKILKLQTLYSFKSESKIKQERELIANIQKAQSKFLEAELDKVLPAKSKDAEVPDDEFIMERETAIYNFFKGKSVDEKIEYLKSFIDKYADEGVLFNDFTISEIYQGQGLHKGFFLQRLLQCMFIEPTQLEQYYVDALTDSQNPILYKIDQQIAFNQILVSHLNKDSKKAVTEVQNYMFELYNEKINSEELDSSGKWTKAHSKLLRLNPLPNLSYIQGKAGSGKTSVVSALVLKTLQKIRKGEVWVAAPTVQKKEDLKNTLGYDKAFVLWETDGLFSKLLEPDCYQKLKSFKTKVEDVLKQGSIDVDKVTTGLHELTITDSEIGSFKVKYGVVDNAGVKTLYWVNHELILNGGFLKSNITKNTNLDVYIDEATLLDPVSLEILSQLSESNDYFLNVILSGDSSQEGYQIPVIYQGQTRQEQYGLNAYYINSAPYLENVFRSNNTANTNNINVLGKLTRSRLVNGQLIPISKFDIDANMEYKDLRNHFINTLQKTPLQYNNNTFQGHELTFDIETFKQDLVRLYQKAKQENSKLYLVAQDINKEQELKQLLSTLNIPLSDCEVFLTEIGGRHIQGAENKYVVLYDLQYNDAAPRSDLKKAYMLASRAKEFTLIYENNNTGLFSKLGAISEYTDQIYGEKVDNKALKRFTQEEIIPRKKELIDKFKSNNSTGTGTPTPTPTPTPTGPQSTSGDENPPEPEESTEFKNSESMREEISNNPNLFEIEPWHINLGPEITWTWVSSSLELDAKTKRTINEELNKGYSTNGFIQYIIDQQDKGWDYNYVIKNFHSVVLAYHKWLLNEVINDTDTYEFSVDAVKGVQSYNKPNDKGQDNNKSYYYYTAKANGTTYYLGLIQGKKFIERLQNAGEKSFELKNFKKGNQKNFLAGIRTKGEKQVNTGNDQIKGFVIQNTAPRRYRMKNRDPKKPFGALTGITDQKFIPFDWHITEQGFKCDITDGFTLDDIIKNNASNVKYFTEDSQFSEFIKFMNKFRVYPLKENSSEAQKFKSYFKYKLWVPMEGPDGSVGVVSFQYRPDVMNLTADTLNLNNLLSTITDLLVGKSWNNYVFENIDPKNCHKYIFNGSNWENNNNFDETTTKTVSDRIQELINLATQNPTLSENVKNTIISILTMKYVQYTQFGDAPDSEVDYQQLFTNALHGVSSPLGALSFGKGVPQLSNKKICDAISANISAISEILNANPNYYMGPLPPNGPISTKNLFSEEYLELPHYLCNVGDFINNITPHININQQYPGLDSITELQGVKVTGDIEKDAEIIYKNLSPKRIVDYVTNNKTYQFGKIYYHSYQLDNSTNIIIRQDGDNFNILNSYTGNNASNILTPELKKELKQRCNTAIGKHAFYVALNQDAIKNSLQNNTPVQVNLNGLQDITLQINGLFDQVNQKVNDIVNNNPNATKQEVLDQVIIGNNDIILKPYVEQLIDQYISQRSNTGLNINSDTAGADIVYILESMGAENTFDDWEEKIKPELETQDLEGCKEYLSQLITSTSDENIQNKIKNIIKEIESKLC